MHGPEMSSAGVAFARMGGGGESGAGGRAAFLEGKVPVPSSFSAKSIERMWGGREGEPARDGSREKQRQRGEARMAIWTPR